jgi:hypothetical protein
MSAWRSSLEPFPRGRSGVGLPVGDHTLQPAGAGVRVPVPGRPAKPLEDLLLDVRGNVVRSFG